MIAFDFCYAFLQRLIDLCFVYVLASKTKKQIFVSYNVQNTDSSFILLVENRIKEEMATFPDKF